MAQLEFLEKLVAENLETAPTVKLYHARQDVMTLMKEAEQRQLRAIYRQAMQLHRAISQELTIRDLIPKGA